MLVGGVGRRRRVTGYIAALSCVSGPQGWTGRIEKVWSVRDQGHSVVGAQNGWGGVVFKETSIVLGIGMYRSCRGVGAMGSNIPFLGDDVQGG